MEDVDSNDTFPMKQARVAFRTRALPVRVPGRDAPAMQLSRAAFKSVVVELTKDTMGNDNRPSDADLEAAFKLADENGSGQVGEFEFVNLFQCIADRGVHGLGSKQSMFGGNSALIAQRETVLAALGKDMARACTVGANRGPQAQAGGSNAARSNSCPFSCKGAAATGVDAPPPATTGSFDEEEFSDDDESLPGLWDAPAAFVFNSGRARSLGRSVGRSSGRASHLSTHPPAPTPTMPRHGKQDEPGPGSALPEPPAQFCVAVVERGGWPGFLWRDGGVVIAVTPGGAVIKAWSADRRGKVAPGWVLVEVDGAPLGATPLSAAEVHQRLAAAKQAAAEQRRTFRLVFAPPGAGALRGQEVWEMASGVSVARGSQRQPVLRGSGGDGASGDASGGGCSGERVIRGGDFSGGGSLARSVSVARAREELSGELDSVLGGVDRERQPAPAPLKHAGGGVVAVPVASGTASASRSRRRDTHVPESLAPGKTFGGYGGSEYGSVVRTVSVQRPAFSLSPQTILQPFSSYRPSVPWLGMSRRLTLSEQHRDALPSAQDARITAARAASGALFVAQTELPPADCDWAHGATAQRPTNAFTMAAPKHPPSAHGYASVKPAMVFAIPDEVTDGEDRWQKSRLESRDRQRRRLEEQPLGTAI